MLNTFILMLALASNPAEAKKNHKQDVRSKATPHDHVTKHHDHRHHPRQIWVWKWRTAHYDVHGHWIHGKWVWTRK